MRKETRVQRSVAARPVARPRLVLVPPRASMLALSDLHYRAMLAGAVLAGIALRVVTVLASSFPLNDGGMFYSMVRDIQASSYRLPAFTSYNGEHIPFFYPPLGFYMAAVLTDLTPMGLPAALRVLPLLFSVLAIFAFLLLAKDVLRDRLTVVAAVFFFSVMPPSFYWMIMGGGLTRAPGFVFALLTIWQGRRMYLDARPRRVATVSALAALTVVTHTEMAVLAAIVCGVFFVVHGRSRAGVVASVCVGALTIVLSAPWWALVVAQHGVSPLVAAVGTTGSSIVGPVAALTEFSAGVPPIVDVTAALALLGVVACLGNRRYVLPGWLLAVALFDQRAFFTSTIPAMAMLAAVGLTEVVLPFARDAMHRGESRPDERQSMPRWLMGSVAAVVALTALVSALVSTSKLHGLSTDERAGMAWAQANTPASSRFVILSGQAWPVDANSEWFPALSGRHSVATVQGTEWLPGGVFDRTRSSYLALQQCANSGGDCLARWSAKYAAAFDYVYVSTGAPGAANGPLGATQCCRDLTLALKKDPRYQLVYDGAGAVIFRRIALTGADDGTSS